MEITARAKYIRMSPRKIRLVANLITGMDTDKAKWQLTFNKKVASNTLLKILNSAIANAKENYGADEKNLKVKSVTVDGGPALKRWMPRAHGRATPLRKETSHVELILVEIIPSGKVKEAKKVDNSDIIKVGTGEFDEIKAISADKTVDEKVEKKAKAAGTKGFASKVLNRKTGSK